MDLTFEISEDELPVFLAETDDQLQLLDEGLLQLEREGETTELLQALFRAAHTLKGAAGMIAHKRLVSLTHVMETAFDGLRKETYKATPELIELCFEGIDALRKLREEVVEKKVSDVNIEPLTDQFSELFLSLTPGDHAAFKIKQDNGSIPAQTPDTLVRSSDDENEYLVKALISQNSIATSARALQIIMALQEIGEIQESSPSQQEIENAKPVKQFTARILTNKSAHEVHITLGRISEIDQLTVTSLNVAEVTTGHTPTQEDARMKKAAEQTELKSAVKPSAAMQTTGTNQVQASKFTTDKTVRTSVERLDNLMNLVGELITDRNRLNQIRSTFETRFRSDSDVETLTTTIAHISRITDQLQSEVMGIRMVPIANVFNKFPRMVRDLATKLGKKVDFVVQGEDTELDRSLIELINDPLIHLLRNAVDHGVEIPDERSVAGKSERARILLSAQHEQGRIIITIEDNGHGINPKALKEKAIKKGLISEADAAIMADDEAVNLIFVSGFSTASQVSDVSGRGVGMDIVRNNIQRLNGTVSVETWLGEGSRFQIILPLTLAIVQTLLVSVSDNRLAIPLVTIMSTVAVTGKDIQTINGKPVIVLRNKVLPILPLEKVFNFRTDYTDTKTRYVVVVSIGKHQMGLLVDRLLGEEEVVVKSLGPLVGDINGISSAAILGDGRVILIIDVQDLFKLSGITQFKH